MSLTPGSRIGPYELGSKIGAGGMGEVYRATDTHLKRQVAIKVLPAAVAGDPERLLRFQREAEVLASLNHPNIATIHGLEKAGGVTALVMELVEGPTLAGRIAQGPIGVDEVLLTARQIAEALETAHEQGIVHRDVKPANIKLRPDGTAKVLDFGLAKALERVSQTDAEATDASTITSPVVMTRAGVVLGTAAYMSPEQARGQPVDKRADIWAFGCVLYEMLAGRAAFARDTVTDTLAAVVSGKPDWTLLERRVPARVLRIVRRCLEKDPRQRLRDIGEARIELAEALAEPLAAEPPAAGWRVRALPLAVVSFVTGAAITGVVAWNWSGLAARPDPAPGSVRVYRLTDARGMEEFPALSPDGRVVAFVAHAGGNRQLFVRLVAGGGTLQLTHDAADHLYPRWAPDSASILYYSPAPDGEGPGAIWEIPALGGSARRITSSAGGADISHDGRRLVFPRLVGGRMELTVSARDASNLQTIAPLELGYYYLTPRWSPDDRRIAYQRGIANVHEIFVVPSSGGPPRQITEHGALIEGLTWAGRGDRLVFSSSQGATIRYLPPTSLWSIDADGRNMRQLTFGEASYAYPDVNPSGTVVATRLRREFDIWRFPVDGSPTENVRRGTQVTNQTSHVHAPSVAPDDSEVVYVSDSGSHANLWVTHLATGVSRQLTFEHDPDRRIGLPLWSPDRRLIAYFVSGSSSNEYFLINADGSNARVLMRNAGFAAWSPDGKWLYYSEFPTGKYLRKLSVETGASTMVRADNASRPAIAPNGATLYYVIELPLVTGGSDLEIRVAQPEDGPSRLLARIPVGRTAPWQAFQPVISPDGRWLAFALVDGTISNLWAISTSTGQLRQLTDFSRGPTFIARRVSWSREGRFLFVAVGQGDGDVVLLDGVRP